MPENGVDHICRTGLTIFRLKSIAAHYTYCLFDLPISDDSRIARKIRNTISGECLEPQQLPTLRSITLDEFSTFPMMRRKVRVQEMRAHQSKILRLWKHSSPTLLERRTGAGRHFQFQSSEIKIRRTLREEIIGMGMKVKALRTLQLIRDHLMVRNVILLWFDSASIVRSKVNARILFCSNFSSGRILEATPSSLSRKSRADT